MAKRVAYEGSDGADGLRRIDTSYSVREGLPYRDFETVRTALELSAHDFALILGVAPRTLARRKLAKRLSAKESDRLWRVAHLARLAAETLGSIDKARLWLHRANRALGGVSPVQLLDTEAGARQVEDVLHRLSYGVYD